MRLPCPDSSSVAFPIAVVVFEGSAALVRMSPEYKDTIDTIRDAFAIDTAQAIALRTNVLPGYKDRFVNIHSSAFPLIASEIDEIEAFLATENTSGERNSVVSRFSSTTYSQPPPESLVYESSVQEEMGQTPPTFTPATPPLIQREPLSKDEVKEEEKRSKSKAGKTAEKAGHATSGLSEAVVSTPSRSKRPLPSPAPQFPQDAMDLINDWAAQPYDDWGASAQSMVVEEGKKIKPQATSAPKAKGKETEKAHGRANGKANEKVIGKANGKERENRMENGKKAGKAAVTTKEEIEKENVLAPLRRMVIQASKRLDENAEIGGFVALQCTMVGTGKDGTVPSLAHVVMVNFYGFTILDEYVLQMNTVTDYRTSVTGITESDLANAQSLWRVRAMVRELLENRILVGHAVLESLRALQLSHPDNQTRDTQVCADKQKPTKGKQSTLSELVRTHLGLENFGSPPINKAGEALAAMALYRLFQGVWVWDMPGS